MSSYTPRRKHLRALEKNLLKYRAFEMVVVLFYVQHLKNSVRDAFLATEKISAFLRKDKNDDATTEVSKEKKLFKKIWKNLVNKEVITQSESKEIQKLITYRNDIGHEIHNLVFDLSYERIAQDHAGFKGIKYDYEARTRLKYFYQKIMGEMQKHHYFISLSFDHILFETAEKTYEEELEHLKKKIIRQVKARKKEAL